MGCDTRSYRERGGYKHHQLHGWHQRHHGRICLGFAHSYLYTEQGNGLCGGVVGGDGDIGGCGVLPVQLPSEGQGEVLCRGCGVDRHCFHTVVYDWATDNEDWGCDVSRVLVSIWCGWLPDYHSSHHAA